MPRFLAIVSGPPITRVSIRAWVSLLPGRTRAEVSRGKVAFQRGRTERTTVSGHEGVAVRRAGGFAGGRCD